MDGRGTPGPRPQRGQGRSAFRPYGKELCGKFMEDDSKQRNKPSTQEGYQSVIDRNIIPLLGRMKVLDVKRPLPTSQLLAFA
jgi:Phage integrase, N-terminal SAM-like domain